MKNQSARRIPTADEPIGNVGYAITFVKGRQDLLLQPSPEAPRASHRFDQFVRWTIRHGSMLKPAHQVIACALALEGLTTEDDLRHFLVGTQDLVRRGMTLHVAWERPRRVLHRRSVSALTSISITRIESKETNWIEELSEFAKVLRSVYPGGDRLPLKDVWAQVLFDASAWLYLNIPSVCVGYVTNHFPLSVLPDFVLDRQHGARPVEESTIDDARAIDPDPLADVKDVACERSFSESRSASTSTWIIKALKQLVRGAANGDSLRTEDFLARKEARASLDVISRTLSRIGTPEDATVLSWTIFMIESGTVRLQNPKMATVARYVHVAVEKLHHALRAQAAAPADLNQEEWESFFKLMIETEDGTNEFRCALASFHNFLIDQFGVDPIAWMFVGVEENCTPRSNHVWPSERLVAAALIGHMVPDARLRETLKVMLAIGTGNKIRISELRRIRLCNVRAPDGQLEIEIAGRRGKSPSARRILDYSNAELRFTIEQWVARRQEESAESDDFLFGDPHMAEQGYRLGTSQRLLNVILRAATGDSSVSFHSLRHTVINDELLAALLAADVHRPISAVIRTAVEAGHRHDSTTWQSYFHRPEEAIRHWIDQAIASHVNSPAAVAKWLATSADSLRQARCRSENGGHCLHDRLLEKALADAPGIAPPMMLPAVPDNSILPSFAAQSFGNTRGLISDIAVGRSLPSICSRNAVAQSHVIEVCRAIAAVSDQLGSLHRRRFLSLSENANSDACLSHARNAICRHGLHIDLRTEPHLAGVVQLLNASNSPRDLSAVVHSWIRCKDHSVVSLMDPQSVRPVIEFLQSNSVPADSLIIRVQVTLKDPASPKTLILGRQQLTAAQAVVEQSFASVVQVESARARGDRPDVYLLLSRQRVGGGLPGMSASCRMNRFHGLMFVLAVWHAIDAACQTGGRIEQS